MEHTIDLTQYGITVKKVHRNWSIARLYQAALLMPERYHVASSGALIAYSGEKTGRSPKEKRVVTDESTRDDIWWGEINAPVDEEINQIAYDCAINFLNLRPQIFVVDGYACWDPDNRIKVRVICARAYHALFMRNMLIRPTNEELEDFGDPDWVILNAGMTKVSPHLRGLTSDTSVQINFKKKEMVILGTEYAGEMKKGIFTVLNYELPKKGVLSMHCSANEGARGDTALFFGLSGTGKTTLS
ncbi:MAG: phosphoenolpyruvate carboxykinase (ATP), partial [Candidatus Sumerlaeia bacterium]|nr:phosphoenolpyruvate carboxykinase (ATP) [Candidatus Sumerlaeia bacterium]